MNRYKNLKEIVETQSVSKNSLCIRIPFWLAPETDPIFCWLHLPKNKNISSKGIVVCNPLGYEYSHAHRTVRHLCDTLAVSGKACIRFDYHGTGDSGSDLFEENRISTFLQNIDDAVKFLKNEIGVSKIGLCGIRLGATLAAAYSSKNEIDSLILWAPCIKGKSYVREVRALEKLASHSESVNKQDKNFIDSGGFILTEQTALELSRLDLTNQNYLVNEKVLIIERGDIPNNPKLESTLKNTSLLTVDKITMDGYLEMMAEPQSTIIPSKTIDELIQWIGVEETYITLRNISNLPLSAIASVPDSSVQEEICLDPESKLFSILSKPNKPRQGKKPLFIFVNSGSVHHVGPNRVYTELVRELSVVGFNCVRLDLGNLGDSVQGTPSNENHPYPSNSIEDIGKTITYYSDNYDFEEYILVGLCSGAHNCLHAGLSLKKSNQLKELILINPLAFYRKPDGEFDLANETRFERQEQQYAESIFDLDKWRKFLTGKANMKGFLGYIFKKFTRILITKYKLVTEFFGKDKKSQLANDFLLLAENDISLTFVIASKDPGRKILYTQAKSTINALMKEKKLFLYDVENADHTFSALECRRSFNTTMISHLTEHFM